MGAKSSVPAKSKHRKGQPKLAIVNANGDDEPATLDIYTTTQFKLERSFPLPLPEQYLSTTCHPSRPVIYVCGESVELTGSEGLAVWRVDLTTEPGLELLSHLPPNFHGKEFHMRVCCHDDLDHLYVLGVDRECMRLNFKTKEWEDIPPFPCKLAEIREVYSTSHLIGIVTKTGDMYCYQETKPDEPSPEKWECRAEGTIPDGNSVVIEDLMYVYSVETQKLLRCDVRTGQITDVPHQLDTGALKKNWFLTGSECWVYFVGKHYSDEKTTVMEVHLESGKQMFGVIAGYLQEGTVTKATHAVFVEDPPKAGKSKK